MGPVIQPHPELRPGTNVGPWLIRARHDKGSYGVVFRAERAGHAEAGSFALKVALHPSEPRFRREVTLLKGARHPSIPRFEDEGWWKNSEGLDFPYVVMEWIEGQALYSGGRESRCTSAQVLQLGAQLASALAAAHAVGGVHRDVKGDNILVTAQGRAVLPDWGCGTHSGAKELADIALPPGTYSYRSPEALRWNWAHRKTGKAYAAGPPDDVYALGVTLYRLCTGTYPPLPTESPGSQRQRLPPCELATVSGGLERLLLLCLSEDRQARPAAAALATWFSAAASEKEASNPIIPTPAAASTDSSESSDEDSHEEREWPAWMSTALASLAGSLVAGLLMLLAACWVLRPSQEPPVFVAEVRGEPPPEAPDGGVGEEALASVEDVPRAALPMLVSFGRPMPKTPLVGQRKPPCDRGETAINGACWVWVGGEKPPCGETMFDHDGRCFKASTDAPLQPISEEPR